METISGKNRKDKDGRDDEFGKGSPKNLIEERVLANKLIYETKGGSSGEKGKTNQR